MLLFNQKNSFSNSIVNEEKKIVLTNVSTWNRFLKIDLANQHGGYFIKFIAFIFGLQAVTIANLALSYTCLITNSAWNDYL